MVKHRGSGWWGERYRHSLASLKGWRQRRTISRSLKRYHKEHLEDGHKMAKDVQIRAEATYPTSDKAAIRRWKQDPAHSDILGVDTDLWRRLKAPQVKARAIYRKSKDRVQKVVQDFKVEKKRIQASKVSQKEKKKRVKQEADRTIRKVAAEHDAAEKISEDAKKEQRKAITRYVKPSWDRERKRRAAMVARSLASDMITADALIGRAERKGWDYDTVNWDELQGKDLMFMDRLNRLERQTGETQTRMEEEGEIDWQIEKYESEYQEFVKAEAQKVAEKGKTKIPEDMAMQRDLSGGGRMEFTVEKEKKGLVKPRYQESKVKPREKPKEQAILTSKEDLAKSSLPRGQETLIVAVVTTDAPAPTAKPAVSQRPKGTKWQDAKPISYTNIGVGSKVTDKSGAVYEIVSVEVPDTVPAHRVYSLKYEDKKGKRRARKFVIDQKLGQLERHYRKLPATSFERHEARGRAKSRRRRETWDKIRKGERYVINASAGKKRYGEIIGKSARVVEKRDPGYSYPITVEVDGERYHLSPKALSEKRARA